MESRDQQPRGGDNSTGEMSKHPNAMHGITVDVDSSFLLGDLQNPNTSFNLLHQPSLADTSSFTSDIDQTNRMSTPLINPFTASMRGLAVTQNEDAKFLRSYLNALKNPEVRANLAFTFNEATDKHLQPIKETVQQIKEENVTRDQRVDKLEKKVDVFEQRDRENNIVITGLTIDDLDDKNKVALELNTKLKLLKKNHIKAQDIKFTLKTQSQQGKPQKIKVAFQSPETKELVMKHKKNLKGQKDIWIGDDLTPLRSNLAFHARRAKIQGVINDTWTYDNKVFVRKNPGDKATKITHVEEITGYKHDKVT